MTGPGDYVRIFLIDCQIRLARAMEFRFDFVTGIFLSFIGSFMNIIFQFLLYSKTRGYPGWTFEQVLLFQAVILLVTGIRETLFGNVRYIFEACIQFGGLDRYLILPFSSIGLVLTRGFQFNAMSSILAGLVTLVYAVHQLKLALQWWQIFLVLWLMIVGIIFYLTFVIFYCAITLRFVFVDKIREVFDRIINFAAFPAEVFSGLIKTAYLTVIPVAVFAYFPCQTLLGRLDIFCLYGSIVSLLFFLVSLKTWNLQMKHYIGAGG